MYEHNFTAIDIRMSMYTCDRYFIGYHIFVRHSRDRLTKNRVTQRNSMEHEP